MTLATPKRFTIEEYHRLGEVGFLTEDDRVELIRGIIMQMASKSTTHSTCCSNILMKLATIVTGRAILQCQDPVVLPSSNSEPYQDLQGRFGYAMKRIILPNQIVALPGFPDLSLDLSRGFPGV